MANNRGKSGSSDRFDFLGLLNHFQDGVHRPTAAVRAGAGRWAVRPAGGAVCGRARAAPGWPGTPCCTRHSCRNILPLWSRPETWTSRPSTEVTSGFCKRRLHGPHGMCAVTAGPGGQPSSAAWRRPMRKRWALQRELHPSPYSWSASTP